MIRPLVSKPKSIAIALLTGLGLIVLLCLSDLGGNLPASPNYSKRPSADIRLAPITNIASLFSAERRLPLFEITNHNPFFTTFFQPPPPPKPPSSRKIELTYHGFYETAAGQKLAFLNSADQLLSVPIGRQVNDHFTVTTLDHSSVTLTDPTGRKYTIEFNSKKELDIPMQ